MFFVYGFLPRNNALNEPQKIALVSIYKSREDAETKRDIENMCWSDEGLIFVVTNRQLVADSTYKQLCERVAK